MMMQQLLQGQQPYEDDRHSDCSDIKRQQGTLLRKSVINPRVKHCNATELRCEKAEEKEPEQLFAEAALRAEERTEHPASSEATAPSEPAETPPV
ncbi:hypothetical protein F2Q70_00003141 [Brassica cretica]|uniref:Uncharacterized protein n=1 Tax=Brassica cretica TaxID=69181 RepID=A0A8S9FYZ4_BRACR|nr:hypothetical protein F2Q68_00020767 [Brassica cretica]KAF2574213.1 hypothetical protein F2Q70_00003141 [Brassica cretica]